MCVFFYCRRRRRRWKKITFIQFQFIHNFFLLFFGVKIEVMVLHAPLGTADRSLCLRNGVGVFRLQTECSTSDYFDVFGSRRDQRPQLCTHAAAAICWWNEEIMWPMARLMVDDANCEFSISSPSPSTLLRLMYILKLCKNGEGDDNDNDDWSDRSIWRQTAYMCEMAMRCNNNGPNTNYIPLFHFTPIPFVVHVRSAIVWLLCECQKMIHRRDERPFPKSICLYWTLDME